MNWFIVFFSLINLSMCIYEDQIGKFDWRQTYVGRVKFAQFDTTSAAKKIIVATEENVLAALNLKTGQIVWRHVLESAATGNIHMLALASPPEQVVIVSGANPYLVRGFDLASGVLTWEWSLAVQQEDRAEFSEWFVHNNRLVHMLPVYNSHVEVTSYSLTNGQNNGQTSKLPTIWANDGCVMSHEYYVCLSGKPGGQILLASDLVDGVQLLNKPLDPFVQDLHTGSISSLRPLDGNSVVPGFIIDGKKIVLIKNGEFELLSIRPADPTAGVTVVDTPGGQVLMQTWNDDVRGVALIAHYLETGELVPEISSEHAPRIPQPELSAAVCALSARDQLVCRMLLTGADDAMHLMQQTGRIIWTREEALANVVAVEFVDLPVSELDAAIESEFDQKEGSVWAAFSRRLQTQLQQLQALVRGERGTGPGPLVRDYFNLHKVLVLVTDAGKIFGMDNLSGEVLWQRFEPALDADGALIFTRRSARHPPLDAYVTVVGKHLETGNGLIVSLNPIRGTLVGEGVLPLDSRLLQAALLPHADDERLHALLLLDHDETVQVYPLSASRLVNNMFIYVADQRTARVQGYALRYDGKSVVAQKTWSVNLGGGEGHRIVAARGKPLNERVHSPGRVLGDRSVLYKYINPNLVLFVTEGPDALHKDVVVAWMVDAVSGAVVAAQAHRRARALPLAVHSEHFLAYLYQNDKHRRTEIATMELYEGPARWSAAGSPFSSLAAPQGPLVERQAFILPAAPSAAAVTHTERSLADKHVLLALSTGAIVELPWAYLEPRRPVSPTPEQREEGLVPYAPELPLPAEAVLNYNRTLHRVSAIYTAPSGLESTSLVLATGLDLFYTRVAPSKTFDLLKDDFDYFLISVVLTALVVATYATKFFASRKMLKLAWK